MPVPGQAEWRAGPGRTIKEPVTEELWSAVDHYLFGALHEADPVLDSTLADARAQGLPAIDVAANQGKLLHLLARGIGARRILEIGTLGGYSTIWLARALALDGWLLSLELQAHHADVARANIERAGLTERVEVRVGPAADSLTALVAEGPEPFDLVFIDADKPGNPAYFERSLDLVHPGSLIIIDNVVRHGGLVDAASEDPNVIGSRRLIEAMGAEARVEATAIQTVGVKGHDGFAIALVLA
jgi:predicted O-methyltransferase YrrM